MSRLSRHPGRSADSPGPAGDAPEPSPPLGARARGRARRRLRYLRPLRDLQLRDLGGLVFDLYRFGEQREALVRGKLDAIIATDKEIATLEARLGVASPTRVLEVRQPGVGGACASCGAFHASDARFCSTCGVELTVATAAAAADRARQAMDQWYDAEAAPAAAPAPVPEAAPPEEPATEVVTAAEEAPPEEAPEDAAPVAEETPPDEVEAVAAPEEPTQDEISVEAIPAAEPAAPEDVSEAGEATEDHPVVDAAQPNGAAPRDAEDSDEVAAVGPRRGRSGQARPRRRRGSSR
jgi:hypothetical protein